VVELIGGGTLVVVGRLALDRRFRYSQVIEGPRIGYLNYMGTGLGYGFGLGLVGAGSFNYRNRCLQRLQFGSSRQIPARGSYTMRDFESSDCW
jgi:hypothetical protein